MISRTTEYALRALVTLARLDRAESVLAREISAESGVPRNYLSKILNDLRRQGIVRSERGPGGGFRLARPAGEISLYDVVEVFEELDRHRGCYLGTRYCTPSEQCCVATRWQTLWHDYESFLRESTVADLAFHDARHLDTMESRSG